MVTVNAPAKVLVTGASGFLAAHIVSRLLSDGYLVIGTGKSPAGRTEEAYSQWSASLVPDF